MRKQVFLVCIYHQFISKCLALNRQMKYDVCMVCVSDDLEAVPVRQFIKRIMELYSNNQHGFSQEFDVSMVFVVGACENVCVCALYMYRCSQ